MWWSKAVAALLLIGVVAGCGFRPMYGKHSTAPVSQELALVHIETIKDRRGQLLRNRLLTLLNPTGSPARPRYSLKVDLSESVSNQFKREDETTTNVDFRLNASFSLSDLRTGNTLLSGHSSAVSAYDLIAKEAYKLAAEDDARRETVRLLADDIKTRVSSYLLNPSKPKPQPDIDKRDNTWSN